MLSAMLENIDLDDETTIEQDLSAINSLEDAVSVASAFFEKLAAGAGASTAGSSSSMADDLQMFADASKRAVVKIRSYLADIEAKSKETDPIAEIVFLVASKLTPLTVPGASAPSSAGASDSKMHTATLSINRLMDSLIVLQETAKEALVDVTIIVAIVINETQKALKFHEVGAAREGRSLSIAPPESGAVGGLSGAMSASATSVSTRGGGAKSVKTSATLKSKLEILRNVCLGTISDVSQLVDSYLSRPDTPIESEASRSLCNCAQHLNSNIGLPLPTSIVELEANFDTAITGSYKPMKECLIYISRCMDECRSLMECASEPEQCLEIAKTIRFLASELENMLVKK